MNSDSKKKLIGLALRGTELLRVGLGGVEAVLDGAQLWLHAKRIELALRPHTTTFEELQQMMREAGFEVVRDDESGKYYVDIETRAWPG